MKKKITGQSFDAHIIELKQKNPSFRAAYGKALGRMPVSTQLAVARREAGLTQEKLARRLHISQSAVAQVERPDGNPTVQTVEKIAHLLGYQLVLQAAHL
ncbi:MAG: hypothetical protein A2107_14990 [Verrucomicrobia bacterium GWF2_62_7]|nr:MAG: hypothetical protein A2107_14990 [Verrucomicrobia bacterium GWF2_62_7]